MKTATLLLFSLIFLTACQNEVITENPAPSQPNEEPINILSTNTITGTSDGSETGILIINTTSNHFVSSYSSQIEATVKNVGVGTMALTAVANCYPPVQAAGNYETVILVGEVKTLILPVSGVADSDNTVSCTVKVTDKQNQLSETIVVPVTIKKGTGCAPVGNEVCYNKAAYICEPTGGYSLKQECSDKCSMTPYGATCV